MNASNILALWRLATKMQQCANFIICSAPIACTKCTSTQPPPHRPTVHGVVHGGLYKYFRRTDARARAHADSSVTRANGAKNWFIVRAEPSGSDNAAAAAERVPVSTGPACSEPTALARKPASQLSLRIICTYYLDGGELVGDGCTNAHSYTYNGCGGAGHHHHHRQLALGWIRVQYASHLHNNIMHSISCAQDVHRWGDYNTRVFGGRHAVPTVQACTRAP